MSIASEIARLQQAKADLKTAINAKGQSIADETIDEYADFVDAIEVGGGGAGSGDYLVRFIDYDGTVLKEEWVDSGNAATAPDTPTHTYLTFVEWNNAYSAVTRDIDVGAIYETTTGKTYVEITITDKLTKDIVLYFTKSDGSTLTVDWGDSTDADTFTNSGAFNTGTHTYAAIGDYLITIWISSGSGTYYFGNDNAGYAFLRYPICALASSILIGENVLTLGGYGLYGMSGITKLMIPAAVTTTGARPLYGCRLLQGLVFPKGTTTTGERGCYLCVGLKNVVLPASFATIDTYGFRDCTALTSLIIPSGCYVSSYAFYNCKALTKLIMGNKENYMEMPLQSGNIAAFSFQDCFALEGIFIFVRETIQIQTYAFQNCYAITKYIMESNHNLVTLLTTSVFTGIDARTKIYLPDALVEAYKVATNWSTCALHMYALSELAGYYNVTFNVDGGSAVTGQTWETGELLDEPTEPTKDGYTFEGWYKEAEFTNLWVFETDTMPASALTLYAKWEAV